MIKVIEVVENQVKLQKELQAAGFNAVLCGNCGSYLLHKIGDTKIDCLCGLTMDISHCPDLWCEEDINNITEI